MFRFEKDVIEIIENKEIIIGITGASGVIYGIRLMEKLKEITFVKSHLIISDWAKKNIQIETDYTCGYVEELADYLHDYRNLGASIASGSFISASLGMVIMPCSMKSLSAIAHGYSANLLVRSADVTMKESKRLVLVPRETPFNLIHLENMRTIVMSGGVILPPMPAFYCAPKSISDIVDHTVGKVLDQFNLKHNLFKRWNGIEI